MKGLLRFLVILAAVVVLSGIALYAAVWAAANPDTHAATILVVGIIILFTMLLILRRFQFFKWLLNLFSK